MRFLTGPAARRLAILPPLIAGIALLAGAVAGRDGPARAPAEAAAVKPVRTLTVPRLAVRPRAHGYGTVAPARQWRAVAEISGRVVEIHPNLKQGALIGAGTILARIDRRDYALKAARAVADLAAIDAERAEIDQRAENLDKSLAIERRTLAIGMRELTRKQGLRARGNLSAAAADAEERAVLAIRQRVQNLSNELALIPAARRLIAARRAAADAALADARLDLARTDIKAPFDLRIARLSVERDQFVRQGDTLAEGDDAARAEITAQFPVERMIHLMPQGTDLAGMSAQDLSTMPARFGFDAAVRLRAGALDATWPARLVRMEFIDPRTRTVGVVVAVDDPIRSAIPGKRPPLIKGMFVEVALHGQPTDGQVTVPRAALHAGQDGGALVYLIGDGGRLQRRAVTPGLRLDGAVTIEAGLEGGETLVLTDLVPAIEGTPLRAEPDDDALARLRREAAGDGT